MKLLAFLVTCFVFTSSIQAKFEITPETKITPNYDFPDEKVKIFEIGCVLTLVCVVTTGDHDHMNTIQWYKKQDDSNNVLIKANHHYELKHETLRIESPVSSDAGTYFCTTWTGLNASITVIANVKATLIEEYFFVESETLNITCVVDGTDPYVTWRIGNLSYVEKTDRVSIERKKKYGRLLINDVQTNDTNDYWCVVENQATRLLGIGKEVSTHVHIWQKYVILWPYIGVCFEVAILCAAIWFYEKRCLKPEIYDLDDIEGLDEDNMEGVYDYDISNPVSVIDVRNRK